MTDKEIREVKQAAESLAVYAITSYNTFMDESYDEELALKMTLGIVQSLLDANTKQVAFNFIHRGGDV